MPTSRSQKKKKSRHIVPTNLTRGMLETDLSELIGYHLYGLQDGYVNIDDEELWSSTGVLPMSRSCRRGDGISNGERARMDAS